MKYKLTITAQLQADQSYGSSGASGYETVTLGDLTLFQVSWILGGLQVLMDEAKAEKEEKR